MRSDGHMMKGEATGFLTFVACLALMFQLARSATFPLLNVGSAAALLMVRESKGLATV